MALRSEGVGGLVRGPKPNEASIRLLCEPGVVESVVQPVVRPADGVIVGYEALARMPLEPVRSPDWWLARATEIGLRKQLEVACLAAAARLGPTPEDAFLFVNLSPSLLADRSALRVLDDLPERLVVELTEQEAVGDYAEVRKHLAPWLARGVRIAIDDTGAGYSSLRHVIELTPDFLKVDRELVRDVDTDTNRRALLSAVAAFASEVGTSVIAEGVETEAELEVIREAEVDLVQGYLLARPGPPWPALVPDAAAPPWSGVGGRTRGPTAPDERLADSLSRAPDARRACSVVVEHLFRQGQIMPSVYLKRHRELRCIAQRGLWQILDGMSPSAGITGRTWAAGEPIVVPDVSSSPDYLEAIPGVVSEICVPITVGGSAIGALNVESLIPLPAGLLAQLERCASLLAERLHAIGGHVDESAWDRTVNASIALSGITDGPRKAERLASCLRDASRMDSAALVLDGDEGRRMCTAVGPLAHSLFALSVGELDALSSLVGQIRSCYTGSDALGRGFVGTDSLRAGGARVVVVLPLWAQRTRVGSAVLAHSRPLQLSGEEVRPLEMLADHLAAVLVSSAPAISPLPV
jgi:EAL domain-containing protein (putative c-di-GMP-specific phosphodiesterase class I)/putative methionine-R-sulfoxide reductase with GAF domain